MMTGIIGISVLGMASYWFKQAESGGENRVLSDNSGTWIAEGHRFGSRYRLA